MHEIEIVLPENVRYIIEKLTENGYEAFAVGGCVRDSILHRVPGDWDITTSALPAEVKALFKRTVDTGIEHGTVTVMLGKEGYEVTTYRIDGDYEDGRHPKSVEYTGNLIFDLKRRDFTINAMAYNYETGLVDEFDGIGDIERKIIRCVGKAEERFSEDALRILRAVRFAAQLGFEIEEETKQAIIKLAPTLSKISRERIHTELNKLLLSGHPEYLLHACEMGIMEVILPDYAAMKDKEKYAKAADKTARQLPERYAVMFGGLDERVVYNMLRGLKLDNATISMASKLVRYSRMETVTSDNKLRRLICEIGKKDVIRILNFCIAVSGGGVRGEELADMRDRCEAVISSGVCTGLSELAVSGTDILNLGCPAGKEVGRVLGILLDEVLDNPMLNDRETLLARAAELI